MREQSLSIKILRRMKETPKGTIYTNSDFIDLGKPDAIRNNYNWNFREAFRLCRNFRYFFFIITN